MKRCIRALVFLVVITLASQTGFAATKPLPPRHVVNLDGTWEIEQGGMDAMPQAFSHTIVVPGLVDMAQPAFAEVGKKSELREAFWYRRTFKLDGPVPAVAILKIHKAQYGTKVFLNGQSVGEHLPCFTPALLDAKPYLKGDGQSNELVVRLGANRESLPADMPTGWDFEKYLFIPGIYDSVELILTGAPYVVNVQTVPDVPGKALRVVAEVQAGPEACDLTTRMEVCEATSGKAVGSAKATPVHLASGQLTKVDVTIPIQDCRFWTPDDPFLYELKIGTGSDAARVRFGMRSFTFDPATKRAMLNGKPYFMRGTNVTCYRFFEDAQRGDLPWQPDWVRRLHQKYKSDALELDPLLHRFSARVLVRHRRRRRLPDPGRVSHLALGQAPGEAQGRGADLRICPVDARAVEPSVRGDLGRPKREPHGCQRAWRSGPCASSICRTALGKMAGRSRKRPPTASNRILISLIEDGTVRRRLST